MNMVIWFLIGLMFIALGMFGDPGAFLMAMIDPTPLSD